MVVTFFTDSTFRLRRTYLEAEDGRDQHFYDLGRWERAKDNRLRLRSVDGELHFRSFADGRLRMLDQEGNEVRSELNYDLARQPAIDRVAGPMHLRGMYLYFAVAAIFTECLTGKRYPVVIEGDHIHLERAYLEARLWPGETLLVTFDGRFVERAPEPGLPVREHLIVERFEKVWPGETCATAVEVNPA